MLLLAQPEYSKKARYGYVRGSEPVKYVRSISDRYQAYQSLAGAAVEENDISGQPDVVTPSSGVSPSREAVPPREVEPVSAPSVPVVTASPAEEETAEEGRYTLYTVRPGDTLSRIARKVYGRSAPWKPIFNANRDQLKSPHNLKVGQVLKIPDGE